MIDKLLDELYWNELEKRVDDYLTDKSLPKNILWVSGTGYSKEKYLEFAARNFFDSMILNWNIPGILTLHQTKGDTVSYSFNEITAELRNQLPYVQGMLIKNIIKADLIVGIDKITIPSYLKMIKGIKEYEEIKALVSEYQQEMNIDNLFLKFK